MHNCDPFGQPKEEGPENTEQDIENENISACSIHLRASSLYHLFGFFLARFACIMNMNIHPSNNLGAARSK